MFFYLYYSDYNNIYYYYYNSTIVYIVNNNARMNEFFFITFCNRNTPPHTEAEKKNPDVLFLFKTGKVSKTFRLEDHRIRSVDY